MRTYHFQSARFMLSLGKPTLSCTLPSGTKSTVLLMVTSAVYQNLISGTKKEKVSAHLKNFDFVDMQPNSIR